MKIRRGHFVYRPYSNTYWQVVCLIVDGNDYKVVLQKVLERSHRRTDRPIVRILPLTAVELVDRDWYFEHCYYTMDDILWRLVSYNLGIH